MDKVNGVQSQVMPGDFDDWVYKGRLMARREEAVRSWRQWQAIMWISVAFMGFFAFTFYKKRKEEQEAAARAGPFPGYPGFSPGYPPAGVPAGVPPQ